MCRYTIQCLLVFSFFFSLFSCGDSALQFDTSIASQAEPFIKRIEPSSAKVGDSVTIFGMGFSTEPARNVVFIGGVSLVANSYSLVSSPLEGEVESLVVTVPSGVSAGAAPLYVTVFDVTSNSDLTFTVTE